MILHVLILVLIICSLENEPLRFQQSAFKPQIFRYIYGNICQKWANVSALPKFLGDELLL